MKKPIMKLPKTFIAERTLFSGEKEYAFAIEKKFLWWTYIELWGLQKEDGWHVNSIYPSELGKFHHASPEPVKEAIDNYHKEVEEEWEREMKQWERRNSGDWEYKKYP